MASMGIDGLVSGLDTTSLINSLMQVEAMPQTLLKSKQADTNSFITALQALNAKVSSLADAAKLAAAPASWSAFSATSSNTGVTAMVTNAATAQASALTFRVDQAAQSQISLSPPQELGVPFGSPTLSAPATIQIASGSQSQAVVVPADASMSDVAAAINAANAGVTATVVRAGTNSDGAALYRLQLTGTGTGAQSAFSATLSDGTTSIDLAGTEQTDVRQASDAKITLYPGSQFEQQLTSSSNTFTDLLTGVDVTVTAAGVGQEATIAVGRDDAALRKLASGLVDQLTVVFSEISSRMAVTSGVSQDVYGVSVTGTSGGLFSGDSTVRGLQQSLMEAASRPVNGVSPSSVGINLDRFGNFTFDADKFNEALAADPAKVQDMLSTLAQRVADVATSASDKYDGTLTQKIKSQQSLVSDLGDQIANWDIRLASRRDGLQAIYTSLEVALSSMQSQSSWLAGQLANLAK